MWANLLSAIGKGAAKGFSAAGKGIKKGVNVIGREIGELGDEEDGVMGTPPFMPKTTFPQGTPWDSMIKPERGPLVAQPLSVPAGQTPPSNIGNRGAVELPPRYATPAGRGLARDAPIVLPFGSPPLAGTVATGLPDTSASGPVPLPATTPPINVPSTIAPTQPETLRDYRGREIGDSADFQRDQYVRRGGTTDESGKFRGRRRLRDVALNALVGGVQGVASTGTLGGGLGGAVAAGAGTAIDPTRGREYRFDTLERPRIEDETERGNKTRRQKIEEALRQGQVDRAGRQADLDRANLERIQAQTDTLRNPKPTRQAPQLKLGRNRQTGTIEYYNAADPDSNAAYEPYQMPATTKEPTTAEKLSRADVEEIEKEGTVEQIAMDLTNSRRDDVISKAPPAFREILQTGKKNGQDATSRQIGEAENWLRKRMDAIYKDNLRNTRSIREKNKAKRVKGGKAPAASQSQPTANLKDLEKLWK